MKKITILLVAMIMIISMPVMSFGNESQFTKVEFIKEVLDAADVEIKEAVQVKEEAEVEESEETDYSDVVDAQYIPYIEKAYEQGIILKEKFDPNSSITKQEAVVILAKVFGERTKIEEVTEEIILEEVDFTDNAAIKPSAKIYIAYALKNDIIKQNKGSFYPIMTLTEESSEEMIEYAKKAHEKYFTREGLSADEILVIADEKMKEEKTYKASGKLDMNMKMNVEGFPADSEVEEKLANQGMNMDMVINLDMKAENPDKAYISETIKADSPELQDEEVIEIFMDGSIMYQKMSMSGDKWIKNDMSSIQNKIQSLQNNNPQNMTQLTDEQLQFFKQYASYDEDQKIDGKEYYVVNVDVDKDAYKRFFKEYTKEIIDVTLEQQQQMNSLEEQDEATRDKTKQLIEQVIENMDMEISYKFYINKGTKEYEKMDIDQNIYMNMDSFIQMIAQMTEEEVDLSKVKVEMITHMKGQFNYYDLGKEVSFPEITDNDIFKLEDKKLQQN